MTVQELISKLQDIDPDADVGHMISDASGWISHISRVGTVEDEFGTLVAVIDTRKRDGTLLPDELTGEPVWL